MKHPVDVHVGKRVRHRRWMVGMTQHQLDDIGVPADHPAAVSIDPGEFDGRRIAAGELGAAGGRPRCAAPRRAHAAVFEGERIGASL